MEIPVTRIADMPLCSVQTAPKRHAAPEEGSDLRSRDALLEERLDLTEYGLDAEKTAHLWKNGRSLCGAPKMGHACKLLYLSGTTCPGCGIRVCSYCLLLV